MAIIKCPECHNSISTTVNKCIHCGFQFRVCPECNALATLSEAHCNECGYTFETNTNDNVADQTQSDTLKDLSIRWETEVPLWKNLFFTLIKYSLGLVIAGFIIAVVIRITSWVTGDLENLLTAYKSSLSSSKTMLILASVFWVLFNITEGLYSVGKPQMFQKWCYIQKIDITSLIEKELTVDFTDITVEQIYAKSKDVKAAIRSKKYSDNITEMIRDRNAVILTGLLTAVGVSFLCAFCISNLEVYMSHIFMFGNKSGTIPFLQDSLFGFDDIVKWWMLIVGVVATIIASIVATRNQKVSFLTDREWVKKHLPQCESAYTTYIEDIVAYIKGATVR